MAMNKMTDWFRFLRYVIAVALILIVFGASLMRSNGYFIHDIYWFQESLGGEKATHFLMGFVLLVSARLMFIQANIWFLSAFITLIVFLEEFSQLFQASRNFTFSDMKMNFLGVIVGLIVLQTFSFLLRLFLAHLSSKDGSEQSDKQ